MPHDPRGGRIGDHHRGHFGRQRGPHQLLQQFVQVHLGGRPLREAAEIGEFACQLLQALGLGGEHLERIALGRRGVPA